MFCMLLYLEAGRTEVHIPIIFSFIPFCRQALNQDKRFHSVSGHVHRYPLFSSFFLPSDLIYFLNQNQLQTREGCWYFEKEVNKVRRPQGSLKQPVMGDLNNRKDVARWDFSRWNCHPMTFLCLSTMCISSYIIACIPFTSLTLFPNIKPYNWFFIIIPRAVNSAWNLMQHFVKLTNGKMIMWIQILWPGLVFPFQIWVENVSLTC